MASLLVPSFSVAELLQLPKWPSEAQLRHDGAGAAAVGVVFGEPLCDQLVSFFRSLDQPAYASLVRAVSGLPRKFVISDELDCSDLVRSLRGGGGDHFRELSDSTPDAHTRSHIEART